MARIIAACACLLFLTACGTLRISGPVTPGLGALYTQYKAPVQVNFDATPRGSKHGTGYTTYWRDPILTQLDVVWGDVSVAKVASDAGIKTVHFTDYEVMSILGIYVKYTLHVYGD